MDLLVAEDKGALESIIEEENNLEIKRALDRLTKRQREILMLSYGQGMRMQDIANSLGISYRTVVNIKGTALINMKKHMKQKS